MAIAGLEKQIILIYSLLNYRVLACRLAHLLQDKARRCSFGRNICFNIKPLYHTKDDNNNAIQVVFEFNNINYFVSVNMMRKWFEKLIFTAHILDYEQFKELMEYHSGSFHFIHNALKSDLKSIKLASVYFKEIGFQSGTLSNIIINKTSMNIQAGTIFPDLHDYTSVNL